MDFNIQPSELLCAATAGTALSAEYQLRGNMQRRVSPVVSSSSSRLKSASLPFPHMYCYSTGTPP